MTAIALELDTDAGPHEGPAFVACRVCGRPLRSTSSVALGIGPTCAGRLERRIRARGRVLRVLELQLPLEGFDRATTAGNKAPPRAGRTSRHPEPLL